MCGDPTLPTGIWQRPTDTPGQDEVRIWANPDISTGIAPPDGDGVAVLGNFDPAWTGAYFRPGNNWMGVMDELRIGTSFASVTPLPEPGRAVLGALGLLALAARRRRW